MTGRTTLCIFYWQSGLFVSKASWLKKKYFFFSSQALHAQLFCAENVEGPRTKTLTLIFVLVTGSQVSWLPLLSSSLPPLCPLLLSSSPPLLATQGPDLS